jgi:hypothetical protein
MAPLVIGIFLLAREKEKGWAIAAPGDCFHRLAEKRTAFEYG